MRQAGASERRARLGSARHDVLRAELMCTWGNVMDRIDVWPPMFLGFRFAITKRIPLTDRSEESIALRKSDRTSLHRMAAVPQKRTEV